MATLEVRPARSRHPSRLRLRQQLMARRRKATSTPTTVHFVRSQLAALMLLSSEKSMSDLQVTLEPGLCRLSWPVDRGRTQDARRGRLVSLIPARESPKKAPAASGQLRVTRQRTRT